MKSIAQNLEDRLKLQKAIQDNKGSPITKFQMKEIEKKIITQIEKLVSKNSFVGRVETRKIGMITTEIKILKIINRSKPNAQLFLELNNGEVKRKKILIFQDLIDIFSWGIES